MHRVESPGQTKSEYLPGEGKRSTDCRPGFRFYLIGVENVLNFVHGEEVVGKSVWLEKAVCKSGCIYFDHYVNYYFGFQTAMKNSNLASSETDLRQQLISQVTDSLHVLRLFIRELQAAGQASVFTYIKSLSVFILSA